MLSAESRDPSPAAHSDRRSAQPPGPLAHAPQPLDLIHLARQTFGDRRLEAELLRLFFRQAEQTSRCLAEPPEARGAGQGDLELVHLLAGSARTVGATRVAAQASECETELRLGDAPARLDDARRAQLRSEIASATRFIEDLLSQG